MRIACKVQVEAMSSKGPQKSGRLLKSILIVGREQTRSAFRKTNQLTLMLCTSNNSGTQYQLQGNVDRVHGAFVKDGKMSFSLKKPNYRFVISGGDPEDLANFARILQKANNHFESVFDKELSELKFVDTTDVTMVQRLVIDAEKNVPDDFPPRLQHLTITHHNLQFVSGKVMAIRNLTSLDLSGNAISAIPAELANSLPRLALLNLGYNRIRTIPDKIFSLPLKVLNMEHNLLTSLNETFCKLQSLRMCNVSHCKLNSLPESLGRLRELKQLDLSNNQLQHLPYTFKHLKLDSLALFGNPFTIDTKGNKTAYTTPFPTPSLMEYSARHAILSVSRIPRHKVRYYMPLELVYYMKQARRCSQCQCRMFDPCVYKQLVTAFDCTTIATTVTMHGTHLAKVPLKHLVCSRTCMLLLFPPKKRPRPADAAGRPAQRVRTGS
ncbi:hypothetical protein SARC_00212 [Sphaeroforma arctica JP610]|uniref:PIF1/LRR1 pleckstrin homology domain-containing protein n=1 Tax=Sphaeroforma arctica JP610 TaxID=667725 RepID=A0A0L0GFU7_9EUKA|nr:hypothetical protein SARC_00212 [Sphaeroforma arctica JP610]KNC87706.1 hypothetical protein SARC_00212 [Sphaeroforma arctica JP610]|eukprot:XP_014161608.1 hypothetical protein SARC_00212 [Sphaeroforma arctica JP610]